MDEENLIEIISQTKQWYEDKIDNLKSISQSPEDVNVMLKGIDGNIITLPANESKIFKAAISVAIELLGKFPVNISSNEDD